MIQPNIREQAAMDAIFGPVANIGLPGIDHNMVLLSEIREGMNEPVTTAMDALPEIARVRQQALAKIYEIATDQRVLDLARAGLYGRDPGEAA